jgi:hypothetical protein
VSGRAVRVGDTIIQLTDAVAVRVVDDSTVWFVSPSVAVRAKMSLADALKLLDWKVATTVTPG